MTLSTTMLAALAVCAAHQDGGQLLPSGYYEPPLQPKILQELRHSTFETGYEDCDRILKVLIPKAEAEAAAKQKAAQAAYETKQLAQARKDHPVLAAALKQLSR